jgi:hypothetical protein
MIKHVIPKEAFTAVPSVPPALLAMILPEGIRRAILTRRVPIAARVRGGVTGVRSMRRVMPLGVCTVVLRV